MGRPKRAETADDTHTDREDKDKGQMRIGKRRGQTLTLSHRNTSPQIKL